MLLLGCSAGLLAAQGGGGGSEKWIPLAEADLSVGVSTWFDREAERASSSARPFSSA